MRWCGTGGFQEQGQSFFIGLSCSIPTIVFHFFPFLLFLSIGWYCEAGVFGLIGYIPLSLSLALPAFFNNNNNLQSQCIAGTCSLSASQALAVSVHRTHLQSQCIAGTCSLSASQALAVSVHRRQLAGSYRLRFKSHSGVSE